MRSITHTPAIAAAALAAQAVLGAAGAAAAINRSIDTYAVEHGPDGATVHAFWSVESDGAPANASTRIEVRVDGSPLSELIVVIAIEPPLPGQPGAEPWLEAQGERSRMLDDGAGQYISPRLHATFDDLPIEPDAQVEIVLLPTQQAAPDPAIDNSILFPMPPTDRRWNWSVKSAQIVEQQGGGRALAVELGLALSGMHTHGISGGLRVAMIAFTEFEPWEIAQWFEHEPFSAFPDCCDTGNCPDMQIIDVITGQSSEVAAQCVASSPFPNAFCECEAVWIVLITEEPEAPFIEGETIHIALETGQRDLADLYPRDNYVTLVVPSVCPEDLDGDGAVGGADLARMLGNWGECL